MKTPERIRLTQTAVDRKAPPTSGREIVWDTILPGFGLRISSTGRKVWIAKFRRNGQQILLTIGTMAKYPNVGDARQLAREAMVGTAPKIENKETIYDIVHNVYLPMKERKYRQRTYDNLKNTFNRDILSCWKNLGIKDITKQHINDLIDAKLANGAPFQAASMLMVLRIFFKWAVERDLIDNNPTAKIRSIATPVSRDRVLTDPEIVDFWNACDNIGWPFRQLHQLLLLTGQRLGEVAGMRWSELDLENATWTIPRERAKNNHQHTIPLSGLAMHIIASLPRIAKSDFVFTMKGDKPVTGFGIAKMRLDKFCDIDGWRVHDLRRTAATGMARLRVPPHIVERILNHRKGIVSGVAEIYNRYEYADECSIALNKWADHVATLTDRNKIVQLSRNISSS